MWWVWRVQVQGIISVYYSCKFAGSRPNCVAGRAGGGVGGMLTTGLTPVPCPMSHSLNCSEIGAPRGRLLPLTTSQDPASLPPPGWSDLYWRVGLTFLSPYHHLPPSLTSLNPARLPLSLTFCGQCFLTSRVWSNLGG